MYAQVVVLTYQSPEIDSYTYLIPKVLQSRIKVGQLVEVPLGKRSPMGIVTAISDKQSFSTNRQSLSTNRQKAISNKVSTLKQISKILINEPILLPYQLNLF